MVPGTKWGAQKIFVGGMGWWAGGRRDGLLGEVTYRRMDEFHMC